jgi:hypothetical protein
MENFYKENIIGNWENDSISYVFDKQGRLSIHWIEDKITKTGTWSIENDEIIFKYGDYPYITWKGRINHINVQELSITDLSHQKGVVDVLYRNKSSIIEPIINNNEAPQIPIIEKNFKTKLVDFILSFFGLAIFATIFGGAGYLQYQYGFRYKSHEYNYFFIGMMLFVASAIPLILTLYKGSDHNALALKGFFTFYASFIIVPLLYYVLVVFFAIITLWYYLLAIGVIIALIVFSLNKEEKWIYKSIIILMSIASLYFLYDAKSILKIKFEVYFDNTNVSSSLDEDE